MMPTITISNRNTRVPEIKKKKIGFSEHPVSHRIIRFGLNDVLVSGGKREIVTPGMIRKLSSKTVKIRFSGVPRARIGEVLNEVDKKSAIYIKPTRKKDSKKIAYYDVLILKDEEHG